MSNDIELPEQLQEPNAEAAPPEAAGFALGKLQPRTLVHQVIDALVAAAAEGLILPGDRIVEVDIAQRLGVSRVPVREALRVLESQGVVVNEPYKGIRLTPVTTERIDQLIEVRVALETTAMRGAIRLGRNRGEALTRLQAIVDDMAARSRVNDVAGFANADTQFHRTLCVLSGNAVLADMWEMLARQLTIIFGLSALGKPMVDIVEEHRVLLRVFEGGDLDEVSRTVHDHIDVEIHKVDLENIIARRRNEASGPR